MQEFLPILEKSRLFQRMDAGDILSMLDCLGAKKAEFDRGQSIFCAGEATQSFGLMLSGAALVVQEDYWGNRNLLTRLEAGQLFAESFAALPETPLNVSVTAETRSIVLLLNLRRVLTSCSSACVFHSRLIENLLSEIAAKNQRLNEKITHVSRRSLRQKLLSYLSAQSVRAGSPDFDIPFNRQQLADYLCADRSALSAELARLRQEGVLDYHLNHFRLTDANPFYS